MTARSGARGGAAPARTLGVRRPAELVELSERVSRGMFAGGMGVVAGGAVYGLVLASLAVELERPWHAAGVCAVVLLAAVLLLAQVRLRDAAYLALRRRPLLAVALGLLMGVAQAAVGPASDLLFVAVMAPVAVVIVGLPRPYALAAAAALAAGQPASVAVAGEGLLEHPVRVLVTAGSVIVPVLYAGLVGRLVRFTLTSAALLAEPVPESPGGGPAGPAEEPPGPDVGGPGIGSAGSVGSHPVGPGHVAVVPSAAPPVHTELRATAAPSAARMLHLETGAPVRLSEGTLQVVLLAAEGLRQDAIAECLGLSVRQVRRRAEEGRRRTGATTTTQLVAWAIDAGLVPPGRPSG